MSTSITAVIDQLSTLIEGQITGVTKIPNPYDPENNSDLFLQNGYGIGYGPGTNTQRDIGCDRVSIEREFQVMLLRVVAATDQDATAIENSAKSVLEDELKLIKAIHFDDSMNGGGSPNVALQSNFTTSDPLVFLEGERGRYFQQITAFSVEYIEAVT
jgi:hypothetical protein